MKDIVMVAVLKNGDVNVSFNDDSFEFSNSDDNNELKDRVVEAFDEIQDTDPDIASDILLFTFTDLMDFDDVGDYHETAMDLLDDVLSVDPDERSGDGDEAVKISWTSPNNTMKLTVTEWF